MVIYYPNKKNITSYINKNNTFTKKNIMNLNKNLGNRGMSLENEINKSNEFYLLNDIAVIHKKPTPIQIVNVDYTRRSKTIIKEAYFRQPSTTDYNGVYNGFYIDFDAKETKNKSSFPLHNFHEHQIIHMKKCLKQKGICFAIIKFTIKNKLFLLPAKYLIQQWDNQYSGGRKSIPIQEIIINGYEIKYSLNPIIPYLNIVNKLITDNKEG